MGGGILHPELKVENGTYAKPMATLGEKPTEPWSSTTIAAGVNGKPESGRPVTVTGEIIDVSCYAQLGKHGEKHRSCGQKCVQNGQPIGVLDRNGVVYLLMPEEHDPRRDGGVDAQALRFGPHGPHRRCKRNRGARRPYRALCTCAVFRSKAAR